MILDCWSSEQENNIGGERSGLENQATRGKKESQWSFTVQKQLFETVQPEETGEKEAV